MRWARLLKVQGFVSDVLLWPDPIETRKQIPDLLEVCSTADLEIAHQLLTCVFNSSFTLELGRWVVARTHVNSPCITYEGLEPFE